MHPKIQKALFAPVLKTTSRINIAVLLLINIIILTLACFWVFHGKIWTDEGWYYGGAVLFSKGYLPYIDFLYHRLPLHVEVYGSLFKILGSSFITGRLISLCFFMAMINVSAWSVNRLTKSRYATLLTYIAFINIPSFLGYLTVSTYSLSALLFALILPVILSDRLVLEFKLFIFVILNFLIAANRYLVDYHTVFLFLMITALLIYFRRNWAAIISVIFSFVLGGGYLFKYTLFWGDINIFYDTINFNILQTINIAASNLLRSYGMFPGNSQSVNYKLNLFAHLRALEIQSYFAIWIVCLAAIVCLFAIAFRKRLVSEEGPHNSVGLMFCASMIAANFAFYYITLSDWPVDKLYVFPYMIVLSVWLIARICRNITDSVSLAYIRAIFAALFFFTGFLPPGMNFSILYRNSDVHELQKVCAAINKHSPKSGGRLLTFTPVLANSGMLHESRLNLELYAFAPYLDHSEVVKRNLMDVLLLKSNIKDRKYDLVALSEERFFKNYDSGRNRLIMPYRDDILKQLAAQYVEVETVQTPHYRGYFKIYVPQK